jgi:hypothetical protein
MADPTGDTFVDGTQDPLTEARADIVRTGASYAPGAITFAMQVKQPNDPRQDERWAGDSTFAVWAVDTNRDGTPDYEIQFTSDGSGLGGSVERAGDEVSPSVCEASAAGYGADGYTVTVDPACLGNPKSFSYRATIYYDTNPQDENSNVASDVTPNGGLSFPITRPDTD